MPHTVASESQQDLPLGEVLEFMRVIWAVHHALQATSKRMSAALGVTGPQRLVLRIVGRFPGISAGRLADILHLHPSTLTGVLARLEARGLLVRRPDPRDKRRARLGLSPKGKRFEDETEGTVEAAVRRVLRRFPGREVALVREMLSALATELGGASSNAAR